MAIPQSKAEGFWSENYFPKHEEEREKALEAISDEAKARKATPIYSGCMAYFPDALALVAQVSLAGSMQHHPGKPMHWEYDKSTDHKDALSRHLVDAGTLDTDGKPHSAKVAWRALANLQTELEKADPALHAKRQAQRDRMAKGDL